MVSGLTFKSLIHFEVFFILFYFIFFGVYSTLAWKISWMEEPGRLQSMGSLRVGHD